MKRLVAWSSVKTQARDIGVGVSNAKSVKVLTYVTYPQGKIKNAKNYG